MLFMDDRLALDDLAFGGSDIVVSPDERRLLDMPGFRQRRGGFDVASALLIRCRAWALTE
jgi:hypothetical protein